MSQIQAKKKFQPSKYQVAIYNHVTSGKGDGFAEAVAGSGKTTTLEEVAKILDGLGTRGLFIAFNKHIADELKKRLPQSQFSGTVHSRGYAVISKALGRPVLDDMKYGKLVKEYLAPYKLQDKQWITMRATILDLIDYVRTQLADRYNMGEMREIADHFGVTITGKGLDTWDFHFTAVRTILDQGVKMAQRTRVIDYTDMIWLPIELDLPVQTFRFVLVDEAQDLSPCQRELAMRHRAKGGRMLFVGDRHQAIYGFAGADNASVDNIIAATRAKTLPLSVCYRCPKSHIRLAQEYVPQIEWADNADEGVVEQVEHSKMVKVLKEGDLVLSRTTAPLISFCYYLIRNGVKAKVRGREIGKGLIAVLKKVMAHDEYDWQNIVPVMQQWGREQVGKLSETQEKAEENATKIQAIEDKVGALEAIYEAVRPKNATEFENAIEALFASDKERPPVLLSTIHRAKGLENDRVFLLHASHEDIPLRMKKSWQIQQERNLAYVALTRAKKYLGFVVDKIEEAA